MSNKIDRKNMRKIAVDCVYSYDFVLLEERTRETNPIEEPIKPVKRKSTVIVNKSLKHGRRKLEMKTEEFERRKAELKELLPDNFEDDERKTEILPAEPKKFDVDEFIINVCESRDLIGDGLLEEDKIRTQKDYEDYLRPVVSGVIEKVDELDKQIGEHSNGWMIDRINKLDLAILRVATYEILFMRDKIPYQVAVNEAVEYAKQDNEKSKAYVNGVLAGIIKANNVK